MHKIEYRRTPDGDATGKLIWLATYPTGECIPVCPYTSSIFGEYEVWVDGERTEKRVLEERQ